jgi:long-chain acyl-CoA synthetase
MAEIPFVFGEVPMELAHEHNAAKMFFAQAARDDLKDTPRCMVADEQGWTPVSWAELSDRVQKLAAFMIERGAERDFKIAVLSNTRLEWGIAGLAAVATRGTLVPVYPTLVGEQLAHILSHSDAKFLVVENGEQLKRVFLCWNELQLESVVLVEPADVASLLEEVGLDAGLADRCISLTDAEARGAQLLSEDPQRVLRRTDEIELDDVGSLIYTSGTTGMPKGVMLSHRNVGINGMDWVALNGALMEAGDVDVLWLPMSHVFGWGQFCLGNQLGFLTYFSEPYKALAHMMEHKPHIFMSVPAYWEKLAQMAQAAGPDEAVQHRELSRLTGGRLRFCLSGGAGLRREVKEFFKAAGIMIIEGYGLTECSPTLTMNRIDDFDFGSVGKPFPSVRVKIAEDGEILAKGENVFLGYYKDENATKAMFDEQGWLKTGDLGRFNERGYLQIVGRKKEILVTAGGKNIPPENIEQRFRDDPLIAHLVVYGDGKKYLTAVVDIDELVARAKLTEVHQTAGDKLREHPMIRKWLEERIDAVNQSMARYETIKKFCIADEAMTMEGGLLTPSLKIKRKKVYERYRAELESLY